MLISGASLSWYFLLTPEWQENLCCLLAFALHNIQHLPGSRPGPRKAQHLFAVVPSEQFVLHQGIQQWEDPFLQLIHQRDSQHPDTCQTGSTTVLLHHDWSQIVFQLKAQWRPAADQVFEHKYIPWYKYPVTASPSLDEFLWMAVRRKSSSLLSDESLVLPVYKTEPPILTCCRCCFTHPLQYCDAACAFIWSLKQRDESKTIYLFHDGFSHCQCVLVKEKQAEGSTWTQQWMHLFTKLCTGTHTKINS